MTKPQPRDDRSAQDRDAHRAGRALALACALAAGGCGAIAGLSDHVALPVGDDAGEGSGGDAAGGAAAADAGGGSAGAGAKGGGGAGGNGAAGAGGAGAAPPGDGGTTCHVTADCPQHQPPYACCESPAPCAGMCVPDCRGGGCGNGETCQAGGYCL